MEGEECKRQVFIKYSNNSIISLKLTFMLCFKRKNLKITFFINIARNGTYNTCKKDNILTSSKTILCLRSKILKGKNCLLSLV